MRWLLQQPLGYQAQRGLIDGKLVHRKAAKQIACDKFNRVNAPLTRVSESGA